MKIFWGDIHNHCGISYGFGSLENALEAARGQLDFCSVTGHAMWPDMKKDGPGRGFTVKYHEEGFRRFADNWDRIRRILKNADTPGKFSVFQSYEFHSSLEGDYHILSPDDSLPLVSARTHSQLVEKLSPRPVIAVPHHVAYTPMYRGCDWDKFVPGISPLVEVFSKHGCGFSDTDPYPYLHTMGPRDSRTTVCAGLKRGCRFGFTASTDHHAGYPGSYGDGRTAVLAEDNRRESIWDALLAGRTYAVTGDKIKCVFKINGSPAGSVIPDEKVREIQLDVAACDAIDRITVYKNLRPWRVVEGWRMKAPGRTRGGRHKIRVEMGWGGSGRGFLWDGKVSVKGGEIESIETCFRGRSVISPEPGIEYGDDINKIENRVLRSSSGSVEWRCTSFRNPSTLHPQTSALIFEVAGGGGAVLEFKINGMSEKIPIGKLREGSLSRHTKPYSSEAFLVHRAAPEASYRSNVLFRDGRGESPEDMYHVFVRQVNGQCAWVSPIWIDRAL